MIFSKQKLTLAVYHCKTQLESIAEHLTLPYDPKRREKAEEFNAAVVAYDERKVNNMLEEAMLKFLQSDSLYGGMQEYCRKFDINTDSFPQSDAQAIKLIYSHRDEIKQRLKREGL